ncbi:hypothetical protein CCHR01_12934 [Colletotrichum chrysophilum]|uniref:Uncharacterized protein n=1 Tax=Colletotrichum chrysophilum TaxID=1836956 RepID=A0AAD9EE72_9PEZI|nr:hypothetical protein CCHR01_12934 [Colletotrichum chrysophilum]
MTSIDAVCASCITSDEVLVFRIFHGFIVIAVHTIIQQRTEMRVPLRSHPFRPPDRWNCEVCTDDKLQALARESLGRDTTRFTPTQTWQSRAQSRRTPPRSPEPVPDRRTLPSDVSDTSVSKHTTASRFIAGHLAHVKSVGIVNEMRRRCELKVDPLVMPYMLARVGCLHGRAPEGCTDTLCGHVDGTERPHIVPASASDDELNSIHFDEEPKTFDVFDSGRRRSKRTWNFPWAMAASRSGMGMIPNTLQKWTSVAWSSHRSRFLTPGPRLSRLSATVRQTAGRSNLFHVAWEIKGITAVAMQGDLEYDRATVRLLGLYARRR